jgi:membrane protein DedA with SNARE-associated domain
MWWQYILVFVSAFLVDVVPFPFPPAFSVMIPLQIIYNLNTWLVIIIGVAGSILGRYVLTLYIPLLSKKVFNPSKNDDLKFLGDKLKEKGWKSLLAILIYSLLPLPTTPIFLAGGMANIKPKHIIPPFFIGKFISDAIAIHIGKFASLNFQTMIDETLSWKSIASLVIGIVLLFALLFIDWRKLIETKKLDLNFKIWK